MNPALGHDCDEWLMVQVAQGDAGQMEFLVRRYGTPLLSFISRMIGDRQRSEDIFQDVFLSVWRKRTQYQFPSPFKPWLFAIAINRVRQVLRRPGERRIHLIEDESVAGEPSAEGTSPSDSVIAIETSILVQQAVAKLPPKQRMVVTMRIWSDFSYGEIAQAMGVRDATVRSNMHDALATIRRHLEPRM